MASGAEVLLMVAVVGLYLYDSALLLHCNEGILTPRGKADWAVGFGSENLGAMGKELYVPNPLQLHRPLFRLAWQFEGGEEVPESFEAPIRSLGPLSPLVWSIAVALFILLPLGLFTRLGDPILLSALVLVFSSIFVALALIWIKRAQLRLSPGHFVKLTVESLICPPFALNLVRHLTINMPMNVDLEYAARRLQSDGRWMRTRTHFIGRLASEMECEDADSVRYRALSEHKQTLMALGGPCHP